MKVFKTIIAVLFTLAFAGWTVLVKLYDVSAIGPQGTEIGFSNFNLTVWSKLGGANALWYTLTEILGIVALAIAGAFALCGLVQLIKRKSLLKADRKIIGLGFLYAVTIVLYVLFEKIVINYRPIIMPNEFSPEASYPSTHTMLVVVIMGSAIIYLKHSNIKKFIMSLLQIELFAMIVLMVAGRLLSGVHWATDIIGGLLISIALVSWYSLIFIKSDK